MKRRDVNDPGLSSTNKCSIFDIEIKRNEWKLTEIWFIVHISPSTHKNTKSCHIHEMPGCCRSGPFSYTQIQELWDRNEMKWRKTHRDIVDERVGRSWEVWTCLFITINKNRSWCTWPRDQTLVAVAKPVIHKSKWENDIWLKLQQILREIIHISNDRKYIQIHMMKFSKSKKRNFLS